MEESIPLQWDNPTHTVAVRPIQTGCILTLNVNKDGGTQSLTLQLPCSADDIVTAWTSQGEQWTDLLRVDLCESTGLFFAVRSIELASCCILWWIDHRNNAPMDALVVYNEPMSSLLTKLPV